LNNTKQHLPFFKRLVAFGFEDLELTGTADFLLFVFALMRTASFSPSTAPSSSSSWLSSVGAAASDSESLSPVSSLPSSPPARQQ
jgi:hypothetical protein